MILTALAAMMMVSCGKEGVETDSTATDADNEATVRMTFTPYGMEPMTREATGIENYCTRLDVWVVNGSDTTEVHQSSTDSGFGQVSLTLNRKKTYTLYAVAHRASAEATLKEGVLAFPGEKVTHTMVCSEAFCPETTTNLSCVMSRIVGMFRMETADAVPQNVAKIRYSIGQTFTRWSIAGNGVNATDREADIAITSRAQDGTVALSIYLIPSSMTTTDHYDITMTALTDGNDVVEQRVFEDVPIKAGCKTTYRGDFFVRRGMAMSFVANDWETTDIVEF